MSLIPVTSVKYNLTVPSLTCVENLLVQSAALLYDVASDMSVQVVATTANKHQHSAVQLTRTVTSRLSQKTCTTTVKGWMSCIRLLKQGASPLVTIADADAPIDICTAQEESWMEAADLTLLTIVREGKTDAIFQGAVIDFLDNIERLLFDKNQTFLVGDCMSMADVIVAQALAVVCHKVFFLATLPQQVHRWMQTCLNRLVDLMPYAVISGGWLEYGLQRHHVWKEWIQYFATPGKLSPLERPHVIAAAAAAPVAAAVAPSVPAKKKEEKKEKAKATPAPAPSAPTTAAAPAPAATTPAPAPAAAPVAAPASTGDVEDAENPILLKLKEFNIDFTVYSHVPCKTAEELTTNVPVPNETETHTKNLFLRDKKHGLFLVTVHPDANVNTKTLGLLLKLQGKSNLRLAEQDVLLEKLKVQPGCVGPLGICMADLTLPEDDKERVHFVLDQSLLDKNAVSKIHSHPLRCDKSVVLTPDALQEFCKKLNVKPILIELPRGGGGGAAGAAGDAHPPAGKAPANRPPATKKAPGAAPAPVTGSGPSQKGSSGKKGETLLALQVTKAENFPKWYSDVIVLSEMISYYDISGCYILRPWSYKMWELIQYWFNEQIQKLGVENAYFPLFVSQDRLEKEKDHVEGFAPEVAWVTKSGSGDLAKPIAIRPTSETIMYPAYSDWIQSHRDLPLKLNQWSNVVRWEFKYPTPFLRTREFLWQEGHTAHTTKEEADEMVMGILDLYRQVYEDLLAVPVTPGYKTEKEKFAGGYMTTTVEAYVAGSGRAIQGATSHNLGTNFGEMFEISFQNEQGKSQIPWQTSWGLTTRTIGVMVMVHGDDTGLVLPPRIAPLQVVIVPIVNKKFTVEQANESCTAVLNDCHAAGLRVKYDDRTIYNPGWKYNHWEQKGVPVRIEVGPRDVENKTVRLVVRHDGGKEDMPMEGLGAALVAKLDEIQKAMFTKAEQARDAHIVQVTDWKDFVPNLEKHNMVLTPWCGGEYKDWEETVKEKSRVESLAALGQEEEDDKTSTSVAAKTLCIPFKQPDLPAGTKCIISGLDAKCWVLWGRSY